MGLREYDDDEAEDSSQKMFKDFDCPACDANNPWDDGFKSGDDVRCFYCGLAFKVHVGDDNRPKFKEV